MLKSVVTHSCESCDNVYYGRSSLIRHKKQKHGTFLFHCDSCSFGCNRKTLLIKHLEDTHKFIGLSSTTGKKERKGCLICPICNAYKKQYAELWSHLEKDHAVLTDLQNYDFGSEEDFQIWKRNIEKENKCRYIKRRGSRKISNCTRRDYVCHRSFTPLADVETRKRQMKSSGSVKIGAVCPSVMIVDNDQKNIHVRFVPVHIGHQCEITKTSLSAEDRDRIAEMLKEGATIDKVLADIKRDYTSSERIHFITRKDLHNIIRDYSIRYMTKLHKDDFTNVKTLVKTLNRVSDSSIVHYDNSPDEFCLIIMTRFQREMLFRKSAGNKICLDATNGLNVHGLHLLTIMVIDETGNGIPGAFCFMKKFDVNTVVSCLREIKNAIGYAVDTTVLMSDNVPQMYKAWEHVMGKPDNRLLSWWHIDKNWNRHLNGQINNENKRKIVEKNLHTLAKRIDDIDQFHRYLNEFLYQLADDHETESFGDYFQHYYLSNVQSWAFCYLRCSGVSVNTQLQNAHETVKRYYLGKKQCPTLDEAINALCQFVRDAMFDAIVEIMARKPSDEIVAKIVAAHSEALLIKDESVTEENNAAWSVQSEHNGAFRYRIRKVSDECGQKICDQLRCNDCHLCIHTFRCTCFDNVMHLNICRHIHKIAQHILISGTDNFRPQQYVEVIEIGSTLQTEQFLNYEYVEVCESKEDITAKLKLASDILVTLDSSVIDSQSVKRHLDEAKLHLKEALDTLSEEIFQSSTI